MFRFFTLIYKARINVIVKDVEHNDQMINIPNKCLRFQKASSTQ